MTVEESYRDPEVEVRVTDGVAVLHDLVGDRYFEARREDLPGGVVSGLVPYRPRVGRRTGGSVLAALAVLGVVNLAFLLSWPDPRLGSRAWAVVAGFTVMNIVLHEGAHVLALRFFGRRIDGVGFRMHYVLFPAFYVRMSQSHMLGKYEKVCVHGAGVCTNLAVNVVTILGVTVSGGAPDLEAAVRFVAFAAMINALPVLGSDGYRVVLALTGVAERRDRARNPPWVRWAKIVGVVLVVWYGLSVVLDALPGGVGR